MRGYLFAHAFLTRENAPRTREKHFFDSSMRILRPAMTGAASAAPPPRPGRASHAFETVRRILPKAAAERY